MYITSMEDPSVAIEGSQPQPLHGLGSLRNPASALDLPAAHDTPVRDSPECLP